MNTNIFSKIIVMSLILGFAAAAPAFASRMIQLDKSVTGVLQSETVLQGNNGQNYMILGSDQNLATYLGKKITADGLVTANNSATGGHASIRIEHIAVD